jgi:hypothetical protein
VWTADHFPLASVVAQFVSDLKLHGEHASGVRWLAWRHSRERRLDGLGLLALLLLAFRHLGYRDGVDAKRRVPEAGVGIGHFVFGVSGRSAWTVVSSGSP